MKPYIQGVSKKGHTYFWLYISCSNLNEITKVLIWIKTRDSPIRLEYRAACEQCMVIRICAEMFGLSSHQEKNMVEAKLQPSP